MSDKKLAAYARQHAATVAEARRAFGGSVVDELFKRFGPLIAQWVLEWMLKHAQASFRQEAMRESFNVTDALHLAARLMRDHRDEMLRWINEQAGVVFDWTTDALEAM